MPPSRVGTINLMDKKVRAHVDEDLNEVAPGSAEAVFIYKRSDLDRLRARRKELGIGGDEAKRVQTESHKVTLAEAERRVAAAEAEVETLRARVDEGEKAQRAANSGKKAAADETATASAKAS